MINMAKSDGVARILAMAAIGSGSGANVDYSNVKNKPQINGNELEGNKSAADLGLATSGVISNVSYEASTGVLTFEKEDGTSFTIDLPLELLIESGEYNPDTQQIVLTLANKDVITIDVKDLISTYYGDDETIELFVEDEKQKFRIKQSIMDKINDVLSFRVNEADDMETQLATLNKWYRQYKAGKPTTLYYKDQSAQYYIHTGFAARYDNFWRLTFISASDGSTGFTTIKGIRYGVYRTHVIQLNINAETDVITSISTWAHSNNYSIVATGDGKTPSYPLGTSNTTEYTPTGDYNPSTKLYTDQRVQSIAPDYDATSTYKVGDYVSYQGKFYKCTTAVETAEAWNSEHWSETTVKDEFKDVSYKYHLDVDRDPNRLQKLTEWYQSRAKNKNSETKNSETTLYYDFNGDVNFKVPMYIVGNNVPYSSDYSGKFSISYSPIADPLGTHAYRIWELTLVNGEVTQVSCTLNSSVNAGAVSYNYHYFTNSPQLRSMMFLPASNSFSYTPTSDYNPATKKYVDDNAPTDAIIFNSNDDDDTILEKAKKAYKNRNINVYYKSSNNDIKMCQTNIDSYSGKFVIATLPYTTGISQSNHGVTYNVLNKYQALFNITDNEISGIANNFSWAWYGYALNNPYELLGLNNTTEYTPTGDYNPATKKYVDDNSGKVLIDEDTITKNAEEKIQTVGIKDVHTESTNKFWTGTRAEYEALTTYDNNTFYAITDDEGGETVLAINLTENGDGTYNADKTYEQIKAVYESNGVLIACVGNSQLPLMNGEIGSDGGFGLTFGYTIIKSGGQVVSTRSIHYLHTSTQESWTEVDLNGEYLSNVFFDITLTKDETAGLLSNKTTAEIKEAIASGLTVRAIYNKSLIPLTFISNNTLIFTMMSDSQSVTITCDNDVWTETITKLLPLSGGAMDGNINMSGNSLLNVQKIHVDGEAPIYLGSTIETGVTNASRITGIAGGGVAVVRANTQNTYDPLFIAEPTNINHAATKGYVDSKITSNQLEHNTLYFGLIDGTNDNWFSKEKLQPVLQDAYINGYHDIMIKTTTGSRFITCSGGDLQSLSKDTTTNLQFVSLQNITGSTTAPTTIFYGYCYANGVKLDESGNVTISGSVGKSGGSVKAMKDTAFTEIAGYDATKTQVLKNISGTLTWVNEG